MINQFNTSKNGEKTENSCIYFIRVMGVARSDFSRMIDDIRIELFYDCLANFV